WNALPGWLRFILKGAAFVVRFASPVGMGQAVTAAAGAAGVRQQPATPRAAVGRAADGRVAVDIKVDQDGQVRGVQSRTEGRGVWADMVRGSAMAAF
ncbi:hypothetical protein, partial [Reyranella sp.]|uniref:hypothetical protein n=1 Tax=Reyranella sp. TaxID=1929291 RepID=UPI00273090D3